MEFLVCIKTSCRGEAKQHENEALVQKQILVEMKEQHQSNPVEVEKKGDQ